MSKLIDMTGQRFGRLTVIEQAERINGRIAWKCICDCGNEKITTATNLQQGFTKSCGCYHAEVARKHGKDSAKHNSCQSRIYRLYIGMKRRCYGVSARNYYNYGAKGITICDEWLGENGFVTFRDWAFKNGYSDKLTIDRIDNEKGYSPNNCRWATIKEQSNNTSRNVNVTYNGETHTLSEWADIKGFPKWVVYNRHRKGWDVIDIITKPIDKRFSHKTKEKIYE